MRILEEQFKSLISDPLEIRKAFDSLVEPRLALRDDYLKEADKSLNKLISRLNSNAFEEEYPSASPDLIALLRRNELNPSGVFMPSNVSVDDAENLYHPLAAMTRKLIDGLAFEDRKDNIAYFNEIISRRLRLWLPNVEKTAKESVCYYLESFIRNSHIAAGGAAWDGDCRNLGGRVAIGRFQSALVRIFSENFPYEVSYQLKGDSNSTIKTKLSDINPNPLNANTLVSRFIIRKKDVEKLAEIRFGEPDIKLTAIDLPSKSGGNRKVIMVGEIKGRTDLSNLYESWLPTIREKMQKFSSKPSLKGAERLVVQLFIIDKMIDTDNKRSEAGFRKMHADGLLHNLFSIMKIDGEPSEKERLKTYLLDLLSLAFNPGK